jgi:hypothetical protein
MGAGQCNSTERETLLTLIVSCSALSWAEESCKLKAKDEQDVIINSQCPVMGRGWCTTLRSSLMFCVK